MRVISTIAQACTAMLMLVACCVSLGCAKSDDGPQIAVPKRIAIAAVSDDSSPKQEKPKDAIPQANPTETQEPKAAVPNEVPSKNPSAPKGAVENGKAQATKSFTTWDAKGFSENVANEEVGFPFGHRLIAVTGSWIAFPFPESSETVESMKKLAKLVKGPVVQSPRSGVHIGRWAIQFLNLAGPANQQGTRWKVPVHYLQSPVAAGPHDSIAFLDSKSEFGASEKAFPAEYIHVMWCGKAKSTLYRLPEYEGPRMARGTLLDLWFGTNPTTKRPTLFALMIDGRICLWELEDGGRPPAVHELVLEEEPSSLNLFDFNAAIEKRPKRERKGKAEEQPPVGLLSAAPNVSNDLVVALWELEPRGVMIRLLALGSKQYQSLPHPPGVREPFYEHMMLSPAGKYCLAARSDAKRAEFDPPSAEVIHAWNGPEAKWLWTSKLSKGHSLSRIAFDQKERVFVTWTCPPAPKDAELKNLKAEDIERLDRERCQKGMLTLWDAETGKVIGSKPFPSRFWVHGLAFMPDGERVVVLEQGGRLTILHTAAIKREGE